MPKTNRPITWTIQTVNAFLELIEGFPILWDSRHEHFAKHLLRRSKWLEITIQLRKRFPVLEEEMLTEDDCISKFSKLKSSFLREVRKMQNRSSGVATTKWEFFNACSFMLTLDENQLMSSFMNKTQLPTIAAVTSEAHGFSSFSENGVNEEFVKGSSEFQTVFLPSSDIENDSVNCDTDDYKEPCDIKDNNEKFNSKRRKVEQLEETIVEKAAVDVVNKPQDNCTLFGELVASELRQLRSENNRKRLKRMIMKAIIEMGEKEDVEDSSENASSSTFVATLVTPYSSAESCMTTVNKD